MAAQQCSRTIGDELCIFHPHNKLVFECKDCPGELACTTCVTSIHKKHELVEIKSRIPDKIVKIKSFIKNTQEKTIPEIVKEIKSTIASLEEKENEYKEEITKVKTHGKEMKKKVDICTEENVSELESLLKETSDMLRNHKGHLEKLQRKLENDIEDCEHAVKSGSDVSIHDNEAQVVKTAATFTIPKIPSVVTTPSFIPCNDPKPYITKAFGEVTEGRGRTSGDRIKRPTKKASKEVREGRGNTSRDRISTTQSVTPKNIYLGQPKTVYNVNTYYRVMTNCISATLDNMTWMYGSDEQSHLISETGKEKRTLSHDVPLWSICTHPVTGKLYCTTQVDNTIRQIDTHTGTTRVLFMADTVASTKGSFLWRLLSNTSSFLWRRLFPNICSGPFGIGCTTDNHLVVTHWKDRKLCIYNFIGDVISTCDYTGNPLARVEVCNKTSNIALIQEEDGVTVLNNKLKVLYTYKGQSTKQREKFCAHSAAFADKYLLVGYSEYVLLIEDGTLLKRLNIKKVPDAMALCVQKDPRVLCVAFEEQHNNKVLCIKYME